VRVQKNCGKSSMRQNRLEINEFSVFLLFKIKKCVKYSITVVNSYTLVTFTFAQFF